MLARKLHTNNTCLRPNMPGSYQDRISHLPEGNWCFGRKKQIESIVVLDPQAGNRTLVKLAELSR